MRDIALSSLSHSIMNAVMVQPDLSQQATQKSLCRDFGGLADVFTKNTFGFEKEHTRSMSHGTRSCPPKTTPIARVT